MPLDEFTTEIESKPRSSDLTSACILCTYEAPKNTGLLFGGNADAPISNGEERDVWLDLFTNGQLDWSSLWTVLDGIAQEVGENLFNAPTVDLHYEGGMLRVEGERMLPRGHLPLCHHVPGQGHQVGGFVRQDQSPCLQARHIEQILSEFIQACSGLIDLLEGFALPCSQFRPFATFRLIHEHLGKAFEHR